LKKWAREVDAKCLVAQRIKRLSSIEKKLRRYPGLSLTEIQDIGGCRAVVRSVEDVTELVSLYETGHLKHKQERCDNYIQNPKGSGYRGAHLVYKYSSDRRDMIKT
jgi:ppGpp synthetase/RelA/SpoT-type nucleotidyltranferase